MSKKYYVVWKGAKTGVFDSWAEVKMLTAGRSDAQFMGFATKKEAEQGFQSTYAKALMKRSLSKGGNSQPTNLNKSKQTSAESTSGNTSYDINIYCDGACSPNPGKAGTGIAVYHKQQLEALWYGLYEAEGTNNTAELNGMLEALKMAEGHIQQKSSVQILSDSKYSIDCITKWAHGWKKKGWTRGKGEAIKNLELIQQCFELYLKLKFDLQISHVKGHANIEGNELSDRMAVFARNNQETGFVIYNDTLDIKTILAMPSG